MVSAKMKLQGHRLTLLTGGKGSVAYSGKEKQMFSARTSRGPTPKIVVGDIEFLQHGGDTRKRVPVLRKIKSIKDM